MSVESSVTQIQHLNSSWPLGQDDRSEGDDHIRNIKVALRSLLGTTGLVQLGFPDKALGNEKLLVGNGIGYTWYDATQLRALLGVPTIGDVAGVVPKNGIIMWAGQIGAIPGGWSLCDGRNGTPNLSDRFILSHGSNGIHATGGSINTSQAFPTRSGETTLSIDQMPSHTHSGVFNTLGGPNIGGVDAGAFGFTDPTGGNQSHSHDIFHLHSYAPPYYVLAFIIKI